MLQWNAIWCGTHVPMFQGKPLPPTLWVKSEAKSDPYVLHNLPTHLTSLASRWRMQVPRGQWHLCTLLHSVRYQKAHALSIHCCSEPQILRWNCRCFSVMLYVLWKKNTLKLGSFIGTVNLLVTPFLNAIQMYVKETLLW